ncbi:Ubiquitin family protein [Diplocarpon rosae]|nr:Ubiquitin family protein [Diplocarpon rosae]
MAEPLETPSTGESEPLSFTLQVVSPSVGVSSPLRFPHLPATTTVKELKEKIRNILPSQPQDDSQRFIHRGRMLARETETMLEIFGQETLANSESQTLHLVLRPTGPEAPQHAAPSPVTPIPQPSTMGLPMPPQLQQRPQSTPVNLMQQPMNGMHAQQPLPGIQQPLPPQILQPGDHQQNAMTQRLAQLQRETLRLHQEMMLIEQRARAPVGQPIANVQQIPFGPGIPPQSIFQRPVGPPPQAQASYHNLINQHQLHRAAEGRHGVQDTGGIPVQPGQVSHTASGRASPIGPRPDSTSTYRREGIGPDGQRWSVTVNQTTTTHYPIPQQLQQQMQQHQIQHQQHLAHYANPASDIQALLRSADRALAQAGQNNMQRSVSNPTPTTSVPGATSSNLPGAVATPGATNAPPASTILAPLSIVALPPSQAINLSPALSSTSTEPTIYLLSSPAGPRALLITNSETYFTPLQSSRHRHSPTTQLQRQGQAPDGAAVLPEYRNRGLQRRAARPPAAPAVAPHANPGPEAALVPAANAAIPQPPRDPPAGGLTPEQRQRGELEPADVAARLIEQRRQAQGARLIARIRRAEHSLLLFLASLVPGVGERHIAAREAEAAAAEARRAEAAAAAEAAANVANTNSPEAGGFEGTEGTNEHRENENGVQNNEGVVPPAQPLVDV